MRCLAAVCGDSHATRLRHFAVIAGDSHETLRDTVRGLRVFLWTLCCVLRCLAVICGDSHATLLRHFAVVAGDSHERHFAMLGSFFFTTPCSAFRCLAVICGDSHATLCDSCDACEACLALWCLAVLLRCFYCALRIAFAVLCGICDVYVLGCVHIKPSYLQGTMIGTVQKKER